MSLFKQSLKDASPDHQYLDSIISDAMSNTDGFSNLSDQLVDLISVWIWWITLNVRVILGMDAVSEHKERVELHEEEENVLGKFAAPVQEKYLVLQEYEKNVVYRKTRVPREYERTYWDGVHDSIQLFFSSLQTQLESGKKNRDRKKGRPEILEEGERESMLVLEQILVFKTDVAARLGTGLGELSKTMQKTYNDEVSSANRETQNWIDESNTGSIGDRMNMGALYNRLTSFSQKMDTMVMQRAVDLYKLQNSKMLERVLFPFLVAGSETESVLHPLMKVGLPSFAAMRVCSASMPHILVSSFWDCT